MTTVLNGMSQIIALLSTAILPTYGKTASIRTFATRIPQLLLSPWHDYQPPRSMSLCCNAYLPPLPSRACLRPSLELRASCCCRRPSMPPGALEHLRVRMLLLHLRPMSLQIRLRMQIRLQHLWPMCKYEPNIRCAGFLPSRCLTSTTLVPPTPRCLTSTSFLF